MRTGFPRATGLALYSTAVVLFERFLGFDRERKTFLICYWIAVGIVFGIFMYAVVSVSAIMILITSVSLMALSLVVRA